MNTVSASSLSWWHLVEPKLTILKFHWPAVIATEGRTATSSPVCESQSLRWLLWMMKTEHILPTGENNSGSKRAKLVAVGLGLLLPILLPYLQFGFVYTLWPMKKETVDRQNCKCHCWDTIFKGTFEKQPAGYHHMYFNVTKNTLYMWAFTIIAVIMLYEATKRIVLLAHQRCLRLPMMALLVASIYPHYFAWWVFINMWNDDFYKQWIHQSYFSITEALSTFMVFSMCDTQQQLNIQRLLIVFAIGLFHIFAGSWDQFVSNVLLGKGDWNQQWRDVALVGLDLSHVIISAWYLLTLHRQHRNNDLPGITKQHMGRTAFVIMILTFIVTLLPWKVLKGFIACVVLLLYSSLPSDSNGWCFSGFV